MNGLERFRGHLYNWYDTHDLRPLDPKYVSSVDSGNLAGHLIVLSSACREIGRSATGANWFAGLEDALEIVRECLLALPDNGRVQEPARQQLGDALDRLGNSLRIPSAAPAAPAAIAGQLAEFA